MNWSGRQIPHCMKKPSALHLHEESGICLQNMQMSSVRLTSQAMYHSHNVVTVLSRHPQCKACAARVVPANIKYECRTTRAVSHPTYSMRRTRYNEWHNCSSRFLTNAKKRNERDLKMSGESFCFQRLSIELVSGRVRFPSKWVMISLWTLRDGQQMLFAPSGIRCPCHNSICLSHE